MPIFKSGRGGARPGAGRKPGVRTEPAAYDPFKLEWRKTGLPAAMWEYVDAFAQGPASTHSHALEALVADHYLFRPLGPGKARPRGADGRFLKGGGLYEVWAERKRRIVRRRKRRAA